MLLAAVATEVGGALKLAAVFYAAAWLLLIVVFVRASLFRTNPKAAWSILGISLLLLTGLWVVLRPSPDEPSLAMRLDQAVIAYDEASQGTQVLISVELRNTGADSATKEWTARYKSDTLDEPVTQWRVVNQPIQIPLSDEPRGAFEYYNSDSIVEKTAQSAVKRGVPVFGRLPLWIPGDRGKEINSGKAKIYVTAHDWQGRPFYGIFQSSGRERNILVLPGEKVAPIAASPTPTP